VQVLHHIALLYTYLTFNDSYTRAFFVGIHQKNRSDNRDEDVRCLNVQMPGNLPGRFDDNAASK
jgi:hypothetical protein